MLHQWNQFRVVGLLAPRGDSAIERVVREMKPAAMPVQVDDTYVSVSGDRFKRNDVILLGPGHAHAVGHICMHALLDGAPHTLVEKWSLVKADAERRHGKYRVTGIVEMIPTDDIIAAAVYKRDGTIATVLWPRRYTYP